ncbi:MAG: hypothetical protein GY716_06040 [bacterium]|nr:hypothetical protein [bacterium]
MRSIGRNLLALSILIVLALTLIGTTDGMAGSRKKKRAKRAKKAEETQVVQPPAPVTDGEPVFAENAFPPVIPDTDWHQNAWWRDDCLRCHETGVADAPMVVHEGMAEILLRAKCRSCHVLIPGAEPREIEPEETIFAPNAFPPMIPASGSHAQAWLRDDCLMCHETGIAGAPVLVHEGMPQVLLTAKCRSCHVQVRADEASAGP